MSGFICEAFGYIPRTGESIKVVVEKENQDEDNENSEAGSDRQNLKEKHLIYKIEVRFGLFFMDFMQTVRSRFPTIVSDIIS